jgi:predicted ATP-dependent serine protease
MPGKKAAPVRTLLPIRKSSTGIRGLDEISGGGLPKGRTTIVCGGPGCGKTMLGIGDLSDTERVVVGLDIARSKGKRHAAKA